MKDTDATGAGHRWRFFRVGGFDQVRIETADDLRNLGSLDQKLWAVLACPTSGLEFDTRTLELLDADGDGQIRNPDIIAATEWVCRVLKDPDVLFRASDALPLAAIDEANPEGAKLLASARGILAYLGKPDADAITVDDVADPTRLFVPDRLNGDGVVPPELAPEGTLRTTASLIVDCLGGEPDRSGAPGVTREKLDAFFEQARAVSDWWSKAEASAADVLPLGEGTAAAAEVFEAVRVKVDDYFTRCRLAAYDARAAAPLNPGDEVYASLAEATLSDEADGVAALPLALAAPGKPLPLADGINPAWAGEIGRLRAEVVVPILGEREELSLGDWEDLSARFAAHRGWVAEKPDTPVAKLDPATLRPILTDSIHPALVDLIERDRAADTAAGLVESVERLVRYRRDLVTLLRNFVSLADFYGGTRKAIFQAGTLYLDQRSCELCLRVPNMQRHTTLAPLSCTYLAYCNCTRKDEAPMTIVAALTGGDVDEMLVAGRNGLFYDRQGRDWTATVVRIVENPVSVRQAFWLPYKRVGRAIGAQLQKFAEARDKAVEAKATSGVTGVSANVQSGAPAAPQAFDIAKFAGIFAAFGLAAGALGTALAAISAALLQLPVWQIPLVIAGVLLLISGPSMLLAWLKLRRRNLGPLLDANGWAVNIRARINVPFGESLTGVARLPQGASRALNDPFAEKRGALGFWLVAIVVVVAIVALWRLGVFG